MQDKREQWSAHLAQWRDSGLSQAACCHEHGVSLSSFGYWRRRLRATVGDGVRRALPIVMAASPLEAAPLRVHLPGGVWLQLPEQADPVRVSALVELKQWLDDLAPKVLGNSGTAKALAYTLRRWESLLRYVDDGRYPIDTSAIENVIRQIAQGRKNWLFAGSEQAGRRAAAIMSLVATARANGLDPHAWLTDTLTRLPTTLARDIDSLLPLRQS